MKIHIDLGKLFSALSTLVATGALAAIAPPHYQPYVEAAGGLILLAHPSPASTEPQTIAQAIQAVTPLLPAKYQAGISKGIAGAEQAAQAVDVMQAAGVISAQSGAAEAARVVDSVGGATGIGIAAARQQ